MGKMRNIVVVPYTAQWVDLFQQEADKLTPIFGAELITLHHIGSTSIPGLWAKPIIDMMPIVRNIQAVEQFILAMQALDYESKGEYGIAGRHFFTKGGEAARSHHIHMFEPNHPDAMQHLDFRDYLVAHPAIAQQYADLKRELAHQFPHDIKGYMAGKHTFIQQTIQQARIWRN